ncbi:MULTISPECIES: FecR domain-containing protein [unclassified Acidovorax]|uniref:FecR domain-containing protein n=1 Tax=unclassified Acidovorax TaxID=2684926 RepID=UPI002882E8EB|nr:MULTISPECIES: FecR domain-containing protein [unclassified Acidovorax]
MSAAWPVGTAPGDAADDRPVPPAVLNAAIAWQLQQGDGSATPASTQAFNDWLAAHPDHVRAWRQLGEIDRQLSAVGGRATRAAVLRRTRQPVPAAGALLGLVLVIACGGAVLNRFQPVGQLLADHRAGTGERRTIVLPDQTVLHLNTRSAVDIAFGKDLREVRLRAGEVAVETRHADAAEQRPFVVVTEDGSLRALGTRFVVRRWNPVDGAAGQGGVTDLTVTQSAVAARPATCAAAPTQPCAAERIVSAGQGARLQRGQIEAMAALPDADAWKDGMLVVDNQPLADVVAALARHRPGHLGVDPAVAGLRVTGTLPLADTDQALLALTAAVPVEVAYTTRWWVTLQPRAAKSP